MESVGEDRGKPVGVIPPFPRLQRELVAASLDADAEALVSQMVATGSPNLEARGIESARSYLEERAAAGTPGPHIHQVEDRTIDGDVRVRIYRPTLSASAPVVTYFHGGGWVIGSLATSDAFCRRLAASVPCAVVSVDYRLAPEHPYPAAVEDAVAAISWTAENFDRPLVVLGDSAGGNIATVATRQVCERGVAEVRRQILAYPTISTEQHWVSHQAHGTAWPLTSSDLAWFVRCYVPQSVDAQHPDISPLHADVSRLPRTTIVLAGCDPLHDEGIAYAEHLVGAGVSVDLHDFTGQIHGFLTMPEEVLPTSHEALALVGNAVRHA
jgi:acetyl esterase